MGPDSSKMLKPGVKPISKLALWSMEIIGFVLIILCCAKHRPNQKLVCIFFLLFYFCKVISFANVGKLQPVLCLVGPVHNTSNLIACFYLLHDLRGKGLE